MLDLTAHWPGVLSLAVFGLAYVLVIFEETTELRKSKPVLVAAGLIWTFIAIAYAQAGRSGEMQGLAGKVIEDYAELFLFLLVSIAYVNTLEERRAFDALRGRLEAMGLSYRQLFWLTGLLGFLLSSLLNNLTTALVMGAVVAALGERSARFVALSCVLIVVAINAGGAFSPFGDITSLMVWQHGKLGFWEFFTLFVPSVVNWVVPAALMHAAVPAGRPERRGVAVAVKPGTRGVIALFAATVVTSVTLNSWLALPPAMGMMLGLGYLQLWSYVLQRRGRRRNDLDMVLDSFAQIQRVEWDTLLFFFGIIFSVAGLGVLGYLELASKLIYTGLGATAANTLIGVLSAIVDNIPLMFAVLTMDPAMSQGQWLLVTLTSGVGGSLLSIGSAAGVALMGQSPRHYSFRGHLKWTWAIAAGYAASIATHLIINASLF